MTAEQERILLHAHSCLGMGGGYYDNPRESSIFQHGVRAVISTLKTAIMQDDEKKLTPETAEQHSLKDLLDGQRELQGDVKQLAEIVLQMTKWAADKDKEIQKPAPTNTGQRPR
jgi:hypothetical protein